MKKRIQYEFYKKGLHGKICPIKVHTLGDIKEEVTYHVTIRAWKRFPKHRKNCECCHHHSLFKGHNVIVHIVVLNCQKCNQCLKCHVSGHKNFQNSENSSKIWKIVKKLSKIVNIVKIVKIVKNCQKISKCWSGHVSSSLWSSVSKVTGL